MASSNTKVTDKYDIQFKDGLFGKSSEQSSERESISKEYFSNFDKYTELLKIVENGRWQNIKTFYSQELPLLQSFQWQTIINAALASGNKDATKSLIEIVLNLDSEIKCKVLSYVIENAIVQNDVQTVLIYQEFRGDFLIRKPSTKATFLHGAAKYGNTELVKYLLSHEEKLLNMVDFMGKTALHLAVEGGHRDMVHTLLMFQADWNVPDNNHITPWLVAIESHREDIFPLFVKLLDQALSDKVKLLNMACKGGSVHAVDYIISKGIPLNGDDPASGNTALIEAAKYSKYDLIPKLFTFQFDWKVNAINNDGMSAFLYVIEKPFCNLSTTTAAESLVKMGANINQVFPNGDTPLVRFAGSLQKVKWLLGRGANPNYISPSGKNAVWLMCHSARNWFFDKSIVQQLLSVLDPTMLNLKVSHDKHTSTPIEELIIRGEIECAEELYYCSTFLGSMLDFINSERAQTLQTNSRVAKLLKNIRRKICRPSSLRRICRDSIIVQLTRSGQITAFSTLPLPDVLIDYINPRIFRRMQEKRNSENELDEILSTPFYQDQYYREEDDDDEGSD